MDSSQYALGPDAQASEPMTLEGRGCAAGDARLTHEGRCLVLGDRKRYGLLRCHTLIGADPLYVRQHA